MGEDMLEGRVAILAQVPEAVFFPPARTVFIKMSYPVVTYEASDVCEGGSGTATVIAAPQDGFTLGPLLLGFFFFGILVGVGLHRWCCQPRCMVHGVLARHEDPQAITSPVPPPCRADAAHLPESLRSKALRSVATQSQVVYQWWKKEPRFQPLHERGHGAWSD